MSEWETVIGLEVHVELSTATKLFSGSPNHFGGEPNTNIDPVTLGLPGALPVLNRRAVELAIRDAAEVVGAAAVEPGREVHVAGAGEAGQGEAELADLVDRALYVVADQRAVGADLGDTAARREELFAGPQHSALDNLADQSLP